MKVGIDISKLHAWNKKRGIGFYTRYLVDSLKKYTETEVILIEDGGQKRAVDILHYPFFDLFRHTLPLIKRIPTVVTIHDVTPLIFPRHYPLGFKGAFNFYLQKLSLKNINAVITDSRSSKKGIVEYLGVDEKKIFPVYLAPAERFKKIENKDLFKKNKSKYKLPNRFVLYIGNVNWNKNLINMAQACEELGVNLVLVGSGFEATGKNLNHPELASYQQFLKHFSSLPNIHILGFIPDDDLAVILNLSESLLLPSFYEGFGLPILEAQACGVPVITGNTSSMPEVAGEGALLVDPENVENIKAAISGLLKQDNLRNNLIRKGFENVKKFSWEKVARETLDVYQKVLGRK